MPSRRREPAPAADPSPSPAAVDPELAQPTEHLPPALRTLRRSFELASLCQFVALFGPGLGIKEFDAERLEADLTGEDPGCCIPHIAAKLLAALTNDRSIGTATWESRLRREYVKRDPANSPLGWEPLRRPKRPGPKRQVGYVVVEEDEDGRSPDAALTAPAPPLHASVALLRSETVDSSSVRTRSETPGGDLSADDEEDVTPAEGGEHGLKAIPWSDLSPIKKLRALHRICEWQFSSAADVDRFRRAVEGRSGVPPDPAAWRMESCGSDRKGNSYWFIGDGLAGTRLWVKREPPKPPRPPPAAASKKGSSPAKKGKASPKKGGKAVKGKKTTAPRPEPRGKKRPLPDVEDDDSDSTSLTSLEPSPAPEPATRRGKATGVATTSTGRPARAAAVAASKAKPSPYSIKRPRMMGLRTSARTSGRGGEGGWQEMPPEWFDDPANAEAIARALEEEEEEREQQRKALELVADPEALLKGMSKKKGKKAAAETADEEDQVVTAETKGMSTASTKEYKPVSQGSPGRAGRRTRGNPNVVADDGWEAIPDGWLDKAATRPSSPIEEPPVVDVPTAPIEEPQKEELAAAGEPSLDEAAPAAPENPEEKPVAPDLEASEDKMDIDEEATRPTPAPAARVEFDGAAMSEKGGVQMKEAASVDVAKEAAEELADADFEPDEKEVEEERNPELKGHPLDPEWIEWEAICCTLEQYEALAARLHSGPSRDKGLRNERDLHLFITTEIIPMMAAAQQAKAKEVQQQEAFATRKRSSRILIKEIASAEAAQAQAAIDAERELRARAERAEKRERDEQARREAEEERRLHRLLERDQRLAFRKAQIEAEREAERKREERTKLKAEGKAVRVANKEAENSVSSASGNETWELNCEICGVIGTNMDDGSEVICCDQCEKWQHLACHDRAAEVLRKPKTDWSTADFVCYACSGQPIPRALAFLRTHINGKPKPPPKPKVHKPRPPQAAPVGPSNGRPSGQQQRIHVTGPRSAPNTNAQQGGAVYTCPNGHPMPAPPYPHGPAAPGGQMAGPSQQPRRYDLSYLEPYYGRPDALHQILSSTSEGIHIWRLLPPQVQNSLRNWVAMKQQQHATMTGQQPAPRSQSVPLSAAQAAPAQHPQTQQQRPSMMNPPAPTQSRPPQQASPGLPAHVAPTPTQQPSRPPAPHHPAPSPNPSQVGQPGPTKIAVAPSMSPPLSRPAPATPSLPPAIGQTAVVPPASPQAPAPNSPLDLLAQAALHGSGA